MNLKAMRKEITSIIDDIKYHSDSLTDLERLPVLQLKVILAKINKLNEKTTILLHYIELASRRQEDTAVAEELLEELAEATSQVTEAIPVPEPVQEEIAPEPAPREEPEAEMVAAPEVEAPTPEPVQEVAQETVTSDNSASQPAKEAVADKLHRMVVTDLNSAIGINERYLYANQLFNNDMKLYNSAITDLNNCAHYQDAESLLTQYAETYQWDDENMHVQEFRQLIERRYTE